MWRTAARTERQRRSASRRRGRPGATVYQDPITPTSRLLPLARGRTTRGHDRRGRLRRLRRHERRPGQPGRSRQRRGRPPTAPALTATSTSSRRSATATLPAGTRLRVVEQPASRRPSGRHRWSRSQGIDDPSIAGYMAASRPRAARQHRPARPGARRAAAAFSPNGDGQRDAASIARPLHRIGRLDAAVCDGGGRAFSTDDRDGSDVRGRLGRQGRRRSRRRRHVQRRASAAIDPWGNGPPARPASCRRRHAAPELAGADARRRARPNGSRPTATASATRSA